MPGVVCQHSLRLLHISNIGGRVMIKNKMLDDEVNAIKQSEFYKLLLKYIDEKTGITFEIILKRVRKEYIVKVRQAAHYLLFSHVLSYSAVGRVFQRDHATIKNSVEIIENLLKTNYNHDINQSIKKLIREFEIYNDLHKSIRFEDTPEYKNRPNLPNQ